ncbi:hypothetical protein KEM55_007517 [Ascosphaera atra]|nr:hypothetical protein KEM55_007517 [Ascosphaera atra]
MVPSAADMAERDEESPLESLRRRSMQRMSRPASWVHGDDDASPVQNAQQAYATLSGRAVRPTPEARRSSGAASGSGSGNGGGSASAKTSHGRRSTSRATEREKDGDASGNRFWKKVGNVGLQVITFGIAGRHKKGSEGLSRKKSNASKRSDKTGKESEKGKDEKGFGGFVRRMSTRRKPSMESKGKGRETATATAGHEDERRDERRQQGNARQGGGLRRSLSKASRKVKRQC